VAEEVASRRTERGSARGFDIVSSCGPFLVEQSVAIFAQSETEAKITCKNKAQVDTHTYNTPTTKHTYTFLHNTTHTHTTHNTHTHAYNTHRESRSLPREKQRRTSPAQKYQHKKIRWSTHTHTHTYAHTHTYTTEHIYTQNTKHRSCFIVWTVLGRAESRDLCPERNRGEYHL